MLTHAGPLFPRSPQQAPFAPARTVLTEKTHLPCIVKILLIAIYVTQASAQRENIWALYKSITQVVKKICSHAIWIGCESAGQDGICFWEGDGLAVQRLPVKQVTLFTSPSLNHKQMFYLRSQNVVYSSGLRFSLPFRCRPAALCVFSTFDRFEHPERKQKQSWQEALPCHVKEQIGRHEA